MASSDCQTVSRWRESVLQGAPDPHRRRRRLQTAAVLGVVFVASFVAYLMLIGDTWSTRDTVLAIIGNAAMIGAVGFLAAGLLTPQQTARPTAR